MNNVILHRRNLHKIPELSNEEYKTKEYILSVLKNLSCEIIHVLQTGVLAYFDAGKAETIAYRADMDALPISEATDLPFASQHEGIMHACGHDCHMAMLLGFAEELNELPKENFENNILLIFQPAEETIGGAKRICDTDIFIKTNTKAILGVHMHPSIPMGVIGSKANEFMTKTSEVDITIIGKSAHCAEYKKGIDAIEISAKLIHRLYEFERSAFSNKEYRLLKFGQIEGGNMRNILPDTVTLKGTYRSFSPKIFAAMINRTIEIIRELEGEYNCEIRFEYNEGYPALINDEDLYTKVRLCLEDTEKFHEFEKPFLISEDFSYYAKVKPACFMYLGTGKEFQLHSNIFDVNEEALENGINAYLKLMNL